MHSSIEKYCSEFLRKKIKLVSWKCKKTEFVYLIIFNYTNKVDHWTNKVHLIIFNWYPCRNLDMKLSMGRKQRWGFNSYIDNRARWIWCFENNIVVAAARNHACWSDSPLAAVVASKAELPWACNSIFHSQPLWPLDHFSHLAWTLPRIWKLAQGDKRDVISR
jgi:hypothetical protein